LGSADDRPMLGEPMERTAEMVFTGDELLRGDIVNSNQAFLGERLVEAGYLPTHAVSVLDDQDSIVAALRAALQRRPAVLLISGGLGPTDDDLTRESVGAALGLPLVHHEELLEKIRARFEQLGLSMSDSNRKQALVPEGATPIAFTGTAPGFWLCRGETLIAALPGVPQELRTMWRETLAPLLAPAKGTSGRGGGHLVRRLRIYGMGESTLAEALQDIAWRGTAVEVGTRASLDGLTLILRAKPGVSSHEELDRLETQVRALLGAKVFGEGADTLPSVAGGLLAERGLTLATAESCTGGLLGKLVTDVPGSSSYYLGGVVSYSNELKTRLLGVPPTVLAEKGAVSEETAIAMAQGARDRLGADIALSVTGIAGPGGGTAEKPVGLVYLGLADATGATVRRYRLFSSREDIRTRAAYTALDLMRRKLLDQNG
jgi:nicotinamide-nucleotide amidase